jgi:hypothetical protein
LPALWRGWGIDIFWQRLSDDCRTSNATLRNLTAAPGLTSRSLI